MMNNLILLFYPVVNVIVTGLFAGVVLRQYIQRHRLYQLYWAMALMMAFVATLAYVGMIFAQPTSDVGILFFRLYYILGGALTAAWLGLGSIALVTSRRVTWICLVVLCVLSALAVVLISIAGVDRQGTSILQPPEGAWLYTIIVLNALGSVAVVGVAVYSGWKLKRRQGTSSLLWANVLILTGAVMIALAGTTARLGVKNIFWLIMALGWTVFFIGVLMASRPRSHAVPEKKEGQDQKKHNHASV